MGNASKKQVQAILRRTAEHAEKDNQERGVKTSFEIRIHDEPVRLSEVPVAQKPT